MYSLPNGVLLFEAHSNYVERINISTTWAYIGLYCNRIGNYCNQVNAIKHQRKKSVGWIGEIWYTLNLIYCLVFCFWKLLVKVTSISILRFSFAGADESEKPEREFPVVTPLGSQPPNHARGKFGFRDCRWSPLSTLRNSTNERRKWRGERKEEKVVQLIQRPYTSPFDNVGKRCLPLLNINSENLQIMSTYS